MLEFLLPWSYLGFCFFHISYKYFQVSMKKLLWCKNTRSWFLAFVIKSRYEVTEGVALVLFKPSGFSYLFEHLKEMLVFQHNFILFFLSFFYSVTIVCIFSLHPTPASPTSLPHLYPPPWFSPCVLYSSSYSNTILNKKLNNTGFCTSFYSKK